MLRAWAAGLVLGVALATGAALAQPPEQSPRPLAKPGAALIPTPETAAPPAAAAKPPPRPWPKPATLQAAVSAPPLGPAEPLAAAGASLAAAALADQAQVAVAAPLGRSPLAVFRPRPRPKGLGTTLPPPPAVSQKGSVCGVAGIVGQRVAPIGSRVGGCGVAEPVRITSVSGIKLSQPMTVDCATATAFKKWVDRGIVPAVGGKGGGIAKFDVGPGYVCRPRNNVRGAKVSEHGRGKAIDLMGLVLKNGQSIDVLRGWRTQPRILKAMHKSACGIFGTVLGPNSDRYHQNHLHVDTARYRSGPYCR